MVKKQERLPELTICLFFTVIKHTTVSWCISKRLIPLSYFDIKKIDLSKN